MRRAYDGDAWHGPPLAELLGQVPSEEAFDHPVAGAHSAAELVAHLTFWKDVVQRRTEGEAVSDAGQHDWRPLDKATSSWDALCLRLAQAHASLVARVEGLGDGRLDEPVPGQPISQYVMLHGVVQHDLYHAGQLAILIKALAR
jgi:uncharacterized damage-inducible protein DinB